jgi:cyclopropane-fatty-acyl-phospholipid synthase
MSSSLVEPVPHGRSLTVRLLARTGALRLCQNLLARYLRRIREGVLTVRFEDGSVARFGEPNSGLSAELRIHSPRFYARSAYGGDLGFAESFMAGEWSCDDLTRLLRLFIANREHLANLEVSSSWIYRRAARIAHYFRANDIGGSRRNIADHYDLGNELFATFLDDSMTYSCALFEPAGIPLPEAQQRKLDRVIDLAGIEPEHHVLEIGCGWGSFALRAVERTGCRVTCLTLSRQQKEWCDAKIRAAGMEDRIEVHLRDYRREPGRYDRIVSIEMLEAVGRENLLTYFDSCERLLQPGGRIAIQVITIDDELYEEYSRNADFIQRYIFPGGHLPARAALRELIGDRTGLEWVRDDRIGAHYATTLAAWRDRFLARARRIRDLGFGSEFLRRWHYYFSYCEAGFTAGTIDTLHIVLDKPVRAPGGGGR